MPSNCVSHFGESLIVFKGQGVISSQTFFSLVGWWWGNGESASSPFWFQLVCGLCTSGQHTVNFFPVIGVSVSAEEFRGHGSEYYL